VADRDSGAMRKPALALEIQKLAQRLLPACLTCSPSWICGVDSSMVKSGS
jgi:hypothetical protein